MRQIWFYTAHDKERGPVTAADLKKLVACGALKGTDFVRKEAMSQHVRAEMVSGLFPATASHDAPTQSVDDRKQTDLPAVEKSIQSSNSAESSGSSVRQAALPWETRPTPPGGTCDCQAGFKWSLFRILETGGLESSIISLLPYPSTPAGVFSH